MRRTRKITLDLAFSKEEAVGELGHFKRQGYRNLEIRPSKEDTTFTIWGTRKKAEK
jgi:hypothetical protein